MVGIGETHSLQEKTMADKKETVQKGVEELHKQLTNQGVALNKQDLDDAVKAAREHMVENCSGCANGWHW
jgi:hypothetical protein